MVVGWLSCKVVLGNGGTKGINLCLKQYVENAYRDLTARTAKSEFQIPIETKNAILLNVGNDK